MAVDLHSGSFREASRVGRSCERADGENQSRDGGGASHQADFSAAKT
jgi:hypothetical protein